MPPRLLSVRVLSVVAALLLVGLFTVNRCGLVPHNSLPHRPHDAKLPLASVAKNPGLQLELVWKNEQIQAIVDPATPDVREANVDDIVVGNTIDSFLFIPVYAAFLVALGALGWVAHQRRASTLLTCIAVGVAIVVIADWLENIAILEAVRHLAEGTLQRLDARDISDSALVKWSTLVVVLGALGWLLVTARLWWTWLLGLASFAVAAVIAYGLLAYTTERARGVSPSVSVIVVERTSRG